MSILSTVKTRFESLWHKIDGEAKAELETALQDAEAELQKFAPLLTQFEADVKAAVADVEPAVKSALEALVTKLLADAGGLLGEDLSGDGKPVG